MPKLHRLQDNVYDRQVYCITGDAKKCNEVVKRKWGVANSFDNQDTACMVKLDIENEPSVRVMWFRKVSKSPEDIGVVAHECLHVVTSAFRAIDIQLTKPSEEAYTYYLESLVRQVFEKYTK